MSKSNKKYKYFSNENYDNFRDGEHYIDRNIILDLGTVTGKNGEKTKITLNGYEKGI